MSVFRTALRGLPGVAQKSAIDAAISPCHLSALENSAGDCGLGRLARILTEL
jgi:hypothetical protein